MPRPRRRPLTPPSDCSPTQAESNTRCRTPVPVSVRNDFGDRRFNGSPVDTRRCHQAESSPDPRSKLHVNKGQTDAPSLSLERATSLEGPPSRARLAKSHGLRRPHPRCFPLASPLPPRRHRRRGEETSVRSPPGLLSRTLWTDLDTFTTPEHVVLDAVDTSVARPPLPRLGD